MVETQFHTRIQVLRSDNGGEFLNHDLNEFFQAHGIIHQRSCPSTPQQNGVAERKNRHLLEVVRASLFGAHMPRSFWGEAVLSAAYLINRIPTSILQFRTPLQTLQHQCQIPPTQNLEPRIFGCVVFVHLHDHQRSKLDPRAEKCVFIGYAPHQKGYRCYHPPSQKVYTSMDVAFREQESYFLDAQEDPSHISESFTPIFFPDSFRTRNDRLSIYRDRSPDENDRSHAANDRSHVSNDRSPPTIPTPPENDRSPDPHDWSPDPHDRHHTQEESIEEFMPAPENSSAPVPHQSSAEDVIQVTSLSETDNINETDCISEGAEPTYQIPKRTNRGKPPVHYEADINAKGKYPINNYVSLTRLSESRVHFVKQLAEIPFPTV
ncbi:unnamed protein product [Prunus brigantina]